jgi:hypothetical protein
MRIRRFLGSLILMVLTCSAFAFERPFPANAKRGKMEPAQYPTILIDGAQRTLSVSARIWNKDNLIQQPVSLVDTTYVINYTEDQDGRINRVWILTDQEASRPLVSKQNQPNQ